MERFKPLLATALTKAIESHLEIAAQATASATTTPSASTTVEPRELETPPDRQMGDFAFPCFKLSKALRKAPPMIAGEIAEKATKFVDSNLFEVKAVGPYVNFTLKTEALVDTVMKEILMESGSTYGSLPSNSREKWVFEFSSPNVAKPFQIYHLRTTIVGSALSKIAKMRGFNVTTINHLGDWGTQYGKLAIALKKYESQLPAELTLKDLVGIYVQIHKDMETDPTLEPAGQEAFRKLEAGDSEMRAIWKKCVDISLKEFLKTYERYQVQFDHYWGESFYEDQLKPLLAGLKAKNALIQDQGAWIVPVHNREGKEITPCILEKSDGSSIYATRDVAAAVYRHEKLDFDRMTYIVGKEQQLHFEQVFGVLRAMNLAWEKTCEHLPTGLYRFKDAKMSTRKGNFITLEEVNEMCIEKALKLMRERAAASENEERKLTEDEIKTIADQVAIGAIVFADLSTDPTKDLDFDVDRVISFEGETGPYLQYAHTRCLSILKKTEKDTGKTAKYNHESISKLCTSQEEIFLMKSLGRFPSALERTLEQRKPSQLATYLIDLAKDFGLFYRECKVSNPDQPQLTEARLALVLATQKVLSKGLEILGIPKPEKM
jgi:arginyl-tRNA synthetase